MQFEEPYPNKPLTIEQTPQMENTVKQKSHEQIITSSPPFPKD